MAGTFPERVHKIHIEFLDQTNQKMTAQKALNAIYRDKECPPWPIEGELSIYPRESQCRIIISKQGKIYGKWIPDSCAGLLRQHVKRAHLPGDPEGPSRQRHLQKLELNKGRLGPPGREVVAEVRREFIRRYKNPPDLGVIHFDEDSSSEDGHEEEEHEQDKHVEEEDTRSEISSSGLASVGDHEQELEIDDEGSELVQEGSELASVEDLDQGSHRLLEGRYEGASEQDFEKEKGKVLKIWGERSGPQGIEGEGEEEERKVKHSREGNETGQLDHGMAKGAGGIQEDMGEASSAFCYERDSQDGDKDEEEGNDQVFEEDVENCREERVWEVDKRWGQELVMWDNDEEEQEIASLPKHQPSGKQREGTPLKRQCQDEDDSDESDEENRESKEQSSKRQCIDGNEETERHSNIYLPVEIRREESPESSEVYYVASESSASTGDDGTYMDHEGDIYMSGQ